MRTTEPVRGFGWFAVFGVAGLSFDVALLALLRHFTALPDLAAVALAFTVTYLINFFLNRRFSFAGEGVNAGPLRLQLLRFLPQVGLDFVLTLTAVELLTGLGVQLLAARVLAGGSNATINYVMYRWWTFRPRRSRRAAGPPSLPASRAGAPGQHGVRDRRPVETAR